MRQSSLLTVFLLSGLGILWAGERVIEAGEITTVDFGVAGVVLAALIINLVRVIRLASKEDVALLKSLKRLAVFAVGLPVLLGALVVTAKLNGASRAFVSGIGLALVLVAVIARATRLGQRTDDSHKVERLLAAFGGIVVFGLVLYFLQSDLATRALGLNLERDLPRLSGMLAVLWPTFISAGVLPTLLVELSYAEFQRAPRIEYASIKEAMNTGLALAFVFIFAVSAQYVATERDVKADFSYFRMTRPGDATSKLIASLDEKLEVFLFYPPASDSAELVVSYFDDLKASAPSMLTVTRLDHALEPAKAKELSVSGNGTIVFKKGTRKENLYVAPELEKARTQLRSLDSDVQKRVLQVGKSRRTVYLTAGHGERTRDPVATSDQRQTIEVIWKSLQDFNFDVRLLSAADGLGQEVPKDAAAVFVIGPTQPFSEPEAKALEAYEQRGGRIFFALDPEPGQHFEDLLKPLGLTFTAQPLAQERGTATLRPPPSIADRVNILTRTFSSHPAATYLNRSNSVVILVGAGGLEEAATHAADLVLDFAVRSLADAWNETNGNFTFDEGKETRKAWGLMAAITRKSPTNKPQEEMRVLVLSDSDGLGDDVLAQVPGNQYLVFDGLKWLLGDEQLVGTTITEADVPLTRSRQQDSLWFYGTTFLAPIGVIGVGYLARRRKKPSKEVKS